MQTINHNEAQKFFDNIALRASSNVMKDINECPGCILDKAKELLRKIWSDTLVQTISKAKTWERTAIQEEIAHTIEFQTREALSKK